MNKISLLDCTLRDGGYVNDWKFGNGTITCIYNRLCEAGVDIIEVGFLDDRRVFDLDRTIQPNTQAFKEVFRNVERGDSMIVAMIDYGTCSIDNIEQCEDTIFDGIRLIFKKNKIDGALPFAKQLMDKGYKVFLQMVSITSYSDIDLLDFIDKVNILKPYAVSIVDTYGLMHKEELIHYFDVLDRNLDSGIILGYHSHNNFQLAYSNCIELLQKHTSRHIVVDGTIYGMGKSAGNAPLELLAMHLNNEYGKEYDLNQILEAIDNNILNIYHEKYWGYSLLFYIAALNDCHPNYVNYLLNKNTISIKAINILLSKIEDKDKLNYSQELIERIYFDYQNKEIDDTDDYTSLSGILGGKTVLVLGPGRSIGIDRKKISDYIDSKNPIVISTNMIPYGYKADYIFITNSKRYNLMYNDLIDYCDDIIATSNITYIDRPFRYVFNYEKLISGNAPEIMDNVLILLLNLLERINPKEVVLAGFDGFKADPYLNYYDEKMVFAKHRGSPDINECMSDAISKKREHLKISFLTDSLYDCK